jgi:thioredoxin 1
MAIIEANSSNFTELTSTGEVLVQFHAAWCGPCKMLTPILEQFSEEHEGITIVRIDVENERDLALDNGVRGIPFLKLMKNGNIIGEQTGFVPKQKIED